MQREDAKWFHKIRENVGFILMLATAAISIISQWIIFGQDIKAHETRIAKLEVQYVAQDETLSEVNERLASIDTSLDFLVGFFRNINGIEIQ